MSRRRARPAFRPTPTRPQVATGVTAALAAGLLSVGSTASWSATPPDLAAAKVAVDKTTVSQGGTLQVTHTVKNRGKGKAGASQTRFYLSSDVKQSLADRKSSTTVPRSSYLDVLLAGYRPVAVIKPGKQASPGAARATVPVGTPTGSYWVLACADDRGTVAEKNEADNCVAGPTKVTVTASKGSATAELHQFADTLRWPSDESSSLQRVKLFCQAVQPPQRLGLRAALDSARAHLTRQVGAADFATLNASPLARTAELSQELAGVAMTQGSVGLTLAALLRAHDLEPRNGGHLLNAAAVATTAGLPNEAIAFLDAAAGLDLRRPAMGVSQQAIAMVTRGNALVMTGRTDAAKAMFLGAQRREPLLSEADTGLATVAACAGRDDEAKRYLRKSRQRHDEPATPDDVRPGPAVDESSGRSTPLRQVIIPETPAQAVKLKALYDQIRAGFAGEIDAMNQEGDRLSARIRQADLDRTRAERERLHGLLVLGYNAQEQPDLDALSDRVSALSQQLTKRQEAFFGGGTGEVSYTYGVLLDAAHAACQPDSAPPCILREMNRTCRPALTGAHSEWRALLAELQSAADALMASWSRRVSGYAAHLADPDAYHRALVGIAKHESGLYSLLVGHAQAWALHETRVQSYCVNPLPAEVSAAPAVPSAAGPGPCSDGVKSVDVVIPLGPTTFKVNCEKIQVGVSAETLPLLTAFGEATWDFRAGRLTFFGGAQFGGKVGELVEVVWKSGIYATADSNELIDIGWRTGPSASVGAGSFESGVANQEMDLSFIAGLRGTD